MAARTDGKKQHQSPFISLLVSMFPQPLKFIQRWCSLACKDIDLTTAKQAAVDGPDQLLHKSANSLQMYLNALLKMLSGLGLRSIDVLTALQQLLKHPARMFGPTVSGHQVLACCVATFSQNHFHDATVSQQLWTPVLSCQHFLLFYQEAHPTCSLPLMSLVNEKKC